MRRRSIERTLFEAALLVLGATACYRSPPPAEPTDRSLANRPGPSPITTHEAPAESSVDPSAERPAERPANPAAALCATYRSTAQVTVSNAKQAPRQGPVSDSTHWDPNRNVAICRIVRERKNMRLKVTRAPTCCPAGMPPGHKCPPAYEAQVRGTRVVIEIAVLAADGLVISSKLTSFENETRPEVRRNCGRRPEALQLVGDAPGDDVGGELAAMAELEAASVPAFQRLARELTAYAAPAALVERARAAARDEVRHARAMAALAARHHAVPRTITIGELPIRSLEAIAIENAVEGCVREAYGALVATYQAERAAPELRAVFRTIARDERRHAALSEAVAAWLDAALSPAERAAVAVARSAARGELRTNLATSPACAPLGVPGGEVAVALFDAYFSRSSPSM